MLFQSICKKTLSITFTVLLLSSGSASATLMTYSDRATFEADIINDLTDTFDSPAYAIINSSAFMKSQSVASIGYESTHFSAPNWNIVSGARLCWGCNGTGQILLDDTSIGNPSGVFGVGLDITVNNVTLPYDAFVTFGDSSTLNIDLGDGARFFGLTSDSLIKSIHFGLPGGVTTDSGAFEVDNVTIGNATIPEPAALALFGLGLAGLGLARRKKA